MPRRLLVRLRLRLERSPLPLLDPVRLEIERELIDLTTPTVIAQARPVGVLVRDDARRIEDTFGIN